MYAIGGTLNCAGCGRLAGGSDPGLFDIVTPFGVVSILDWNPFAPSPIPSPIDAGKLGPSDVPPMWREAPWEDPDKLERTYQDAVNLSRDAESYAVRFDSRLYSRDAWLEAAINIYKAANEFGTLVGDIQDMIDGRTAEYAASGAQYPGLSDRAIKSLQTAGEEMTHALQIADALYQGAKDVAGWRVQEARKRAAGSYAEALEKLAAEARTEVHQAVIDTAKAGGGAIGEGIKSAGEASFPWGPLVLLGIAGVVAIKFLPGPK